MCETNYSSEFYKGMLVNISERNALNKKITEFSVNENTK